MVVEGLIEMVQVVEVVLSGRLRVVMCRKGIAGVDGDVEGECHVSGGCCVHIGMGRVVKIGPRRWERMVLSVGSWQWGRQNRSRGIVVAGRRRFWGGGRQ